MERGREGGSTEGGREADVLEASYDHDQYAEPVEQSDRISKVQCSKGHQEHLGGGKGQQRPSGLDGHIELYSTSILYYYAVVCGWPSTHSHRTCLTFAAMHNVSGEVTLLAMKLETLREKDNTPESKTT